MTGVAGAETPARFGRWAVMIAAGVLMAVANGEFAHPLATWVAPALFVIALRGTSLRRAMLVGYLVFLLAWLVAWPGVFRLGLLELAPMAIILSMIGFIPFLLDRIAAPHLPAFASTLVLPCANALVEHALAGVSPFGAWGLIAYSQADWPVVAQAASLIGGLGLGFVILWAAALAAALWQHRRDPARRVVLATALAALPVALLGFGYARLLENPPGPGMSTAIVLPSVQGNRNYDERLAPAIIDSQLALSEAAAARGARLVVWPEDSFFIRSTAEAALLARAGALARRRNITLGLTYGVRFEPTGLRYRNRSVLIGPDGAPAWRYDKSHAVPGYESRYMTTGNGVMARAATGFGSVAGGVCFDGDHDPFLRQLGDAAVLLIPSDDWSAIRQLHARMARLRAIELGVPAVRPTINGISFITDRMGRATAWTDSRDAQRRLTLGTLTPDTRRTLFARSAPVLPIASLIGLICLLSAAALRARNRRMSGMRGGGTQ